MDGGGNNSNTTLTGSSQQQLNTLQAHFYKMITCKVTFITEYNGAVKGQAHPCPTLSVISRQDGLPQWLTKHSLLLQ